MKKLLLSYSFVISVVASLVAPYILDSLIEGADLTTQYPLSAGICFVLFWITTLATGVKFVPESQSSEKGWRFNEKDIDRDSGTVKWFNVTKGFGFITRDQGDDVFVHFRSIRGQGHRSLLEGQRVYFTVTESDKGMQAEDVSLAD
jgi:CspA family cold shock protein